MPSPDLITVDFSGTLTIEQDVVRFESIHNEDPVVITGREWSNLSDDEKSNFMLKSIEDCIHGAYDLSFIEIDITDETD
jgi:hypothetical protein